MKAFFLLLLLTATTSLLFVSCKDASSGITTFCDTACLKDSMKFILNEHPLKPYVLISARDCNADSVAWSYTDMGLNRKMSIIDLAADPVKMNPSATGCFIKDTSYAWLYFNDCTTGRGYQFKIRFNKGNKLERRSSGLNAFDRKFNVAEGLIAYSDRGNLFTEDMATGKQATMTFGQRLDIDYDAVHEFIDSIHVTPTRMWARVKIGDEWKELEKQVTLK